jgi:hypothetical protein
LEQRQLASPDLHTAFQLALCNYIGFGGPREEKSLNSALQYSGRALDELEDIVASMRPYERVDKRWRNAEELRKELVLIYRTLVPEEDRAMLRAKQNLAATYGYLGRHQEAQELQKVVDSNTKFLGKNHANTLHSMSHLAFLYEGQEQWEQAKELEEYIIEERKTILGEEHIDTLHNMDSLALIYHKQDLWEKSRKLWVRVVEISKRALGGEHSDTLLHTSNLARAYCDRGYLQEAKKLQEQVAKTSKTVFGEQHPRTLTNMSELALTLRR